MSDTQITEQQPAQVPQPHTKRTFQQLVESDQFKSQIMAALPKSLTVERFVRVLMTATIKTPKLLECTQESMFQGIFSCAAIGLELDGRRAALVPLRNRKKEGQPLEANLWIMYQGIAELVMRSGLVSNIHADLVCDKDEFEYDRGILTKHKINYREDRGEPYATYSIIRMKDGSEKVEVMSSMEIERIRLASPGKDADAWRLNWGEMAKKTVFKRAAKWVPLSAETRDAIEKEDDSVLNVTGTGREQPPALTAGESAPTQEQSVRPAAPPRSNKGAAAVVENPKPDNKTGAIDVPATTVPAAQEQPANPPAPEPKAPATPPVEQAASSTAPRAFLKPDETITVVCEVVEVKTLMVGVKGEKGEKGVRQLQPSVSLQLKGDFASTEKTPVYHFGGATGTDENALTPLPVWKVGGRVKATLFGRQNKTNGTVMTLVTAVEPIAVSNQMEVE